jgi:hypothetical protein
MSNSLVVKAASLIKAGDIAGAEFALVSLAESDGDHALVAVLEDLPPMDLLAVIREFDTSKESVINLLITPEQFARAVIIEKKYDDKSRSHLRGMINSIIFRDETQTADFIKAIGEVDGGCEALVDYLSDRDHEVTHFGKFDTFNINHEEEGQEVERHEVSDRDWKELTWLLKYEHPDMFEQIWPELNSRVQKRLRLEAEEELREKQEMDEMREEVRDELREEVRQQPDTGRNAQSSALASGEESAL